MIRYKPRDVIFISGFVLTAGGVVIGLKSMLDWILYSYGERVVLLLAVIVGIGLISIWYITEDIDD